MTLSESSSQCFSAIFPGFLLCLCRLPPFDPSALLSLSHFFYFLPPSFRCISSMSLPFLILLFLFPFTKSSPSFHLGLFPFLYPLSMISSLPIFHEITHSSTLSLSLSHLVFL